MDIRPASGMKFPVSPETVKGLATNITGHAVTLPNDSFKTGKTDQLEQDLTDLINQARSFKTQGAPTGKVSHSGKGSGSGKGSTSRPSGGSGKGRPSGGTGKGSGSGKGRAHAGVSHSGKGRPSSGSGKGSASRPSTRPSGGSGKGRPSSGGGKGSPSRPSSGGGKGSRPRGK